MASISWIEKFKRKQDHQVKQLQKTFWGMPVGSRMLIPTPQIIQDYINQSEPGDQLDIKVMRTDLALMYHADFTCPMTTGIFLRIVAEANYEKLLSGSAVKLLCPFWRIIDPDSALAKKLTCGTDFIIQNIALEKG